MAKKLSATAKKIITALSDGWVLKCSTGFGSPMRAYLVKMDGDMIGSTQAVRMDVLHRVRQSGLVQEAFNDFKYEYRLLPTNTTEG